MLAKTKPLFEIREVRSGSDAKKVVMRPSQPPPLDVPVYPSEVVMMNQSLS